MSSKLGQERQKYLANTVKNVIREKQFKFWRSSLNSGDLNSGV